MDNKNNFTPFVISLLNNLEDEIKTVIDASVPNKSQNRAAQKMVADYFFQSRNFYIETTGKGISKSPENSNLASIDLQG